MNNEPPFNSDSAATWCRRWRSLLPAPNGAYVSSSDPAIISEVVAAACSGSKWVIAIDPLGLVFPLIASAMGAPWETPTRVRVVERDFDENVAALVLETPDGDWGVTLDRSEAVTALKLAIIAPPGLPHAELVDVLLHANDDSDSLPKLAQVSLQRLIALAPLRTIDAEAEPRWPALWARALTTAPVSPDAVRRAAVVCAGRRVRPALGEFRELCERAEVGERIDAPMVSLEEENALLVLHHLRQKLPELSGQALADALLIAATVVTAREARTVGEWSTGSVEVHLVGRARLFADASVGWNENAKAGQGPWQEHLGKQT